MAVAWRALLHQGGQASPRDVHGSRRATPAAAHPVSGLEPNYFRFRISPDITLAIGANVIAPGQETHNTTAEMVGTHLPNADEMDAYERVLGDAMRGDATLFAREDYVEEAWRIVDPIMKNGSPVYEYEPGTWGPREVDARVSPPGGWHTPTLSATRAQPREVAVQ